jgi:hypothetical protein
MVKRIVAVSLGLALAVLIASYGSADGHPIAGKRLPATGAVRPLAKNSPSLAAGTQDVTPLMYDSGPELYAPDYDVVDAEWSVRFTPPQACSLVYIELATVETAGNMAISVYSDAGGVPGTAIAGPYAFAAAGDLTLEQIQFPAPIDVGTEDFHVAIGITQTPTPHPTFDGDGGTMRTSYRGPGETWTNVENLDMVMRAYVRTYGDDYSAPTLLHIPVTVAFAENGAVDIVAKITDQSGIQSANLHYSTTGVQYQSATLTGGGEFYYGTIPSYSAGTHVSYYLDAQDNAPGVNTAVLPASGQLEPFTYVVQPGKELMHDDGMPEQFYIESDLYDGNAFAVNFWPSSYPILVTHIRALVDDTARYVLVIQQDVSGSPGDVIAGPYVVNADPYSGWTDVYIPHADQPMLTYGGFFVVLYWFPETPEFPGVATDVSQPANHSYWYDNAFGWNRFSGGDWIMRAAVETPTGVVEMLDTEPPRNHRLAQNSPNPFNPTTSIRFSLPQSSSAKILIHNVLGQTVREFQLGVLEPGEYSVEWDGRDLNGHYASTGVYFYTLRTDFFTQTRKMLLLK